MKNNIQLLSSGEAVESLPVCKFQIHAKSPDHRAHAQQYDVADEEHM
jgi:hypothetical protein